MNSKQMLTIVEQYCQKIASTNPSVKIIRIEDHMTMFVEQTTEGGRGIMLYEYKVDGKTYWAGYSMRSQTVYISLAA